MALDRLERELKERIRREEAQHDRGAKPSNALWDHLTRVASLAEQLGRTEGLEPQLCRLAALFHDAGKFAGGAYHGDDRPEEDRSVEVLRELAGDLPAERVEKAADAILQLYRDDPEPTALARVLFDADNLDKLGPLGVANFFVKRGLRGGGISRSWLTRLTVELTYARHAPRTLMTSAGRERARRRGPQTREILLSLIETLREDGLVDLQVDEVEFDGMTLEIVVPRVCTCGGPLSRRIWDMKGMKCSEIHVEHRCDVCGDRHELRFCRPRLTACDEKSPIPLQ